MEALSLGMCERGVYYPHLAARAILGPIHRQATRDRKTECIRYTHQIKHPDAWRNDSHQMCKCQAHARYIELGPKLHHVESREANNMPEGICACGRGICDLSGVVQLPLVTEMPLWQATYRLRKGFARE